MYKNQRRAYILTINIISVVIYKKETHPKNSFPVSTQRSCASQSKLLIKKMINFPKEQSFYETEREREKSESKEIPLVWMRMSEKAHKSNFRGFKFWSGRGVEYLMRISRVRTERIFVRVHICDPKQLLPLYFSYSHNRVLPDRHRQHRVTFIVYVLSNQIHPPFNYPKLPDQ